MVWHGKRLAQREGNVSVIVVIALPILLGIAALTIDIGRLALGAGHLQNVVDAAGLAAAAEVGNPSEVISGVTEIVGANNEQTPSWAVNVDDGEDITLYSSGEEVPGHGTLAAGEQAVEVTGHLEIEYTFAKIFGLESTQLTRSATAIHRPGSGGPYAIFAGESSPSQTVITNNGSSAYIDGSVHGNSKVRFNGSNHTVTGVFEYVNDYTLNGSGHDIQGGIVESTVMSYPIDFTWDQFGPTDTTLSDIRINGSGQTLPSGTIHVLGDITVNGSGHFAQNSLYMVEGKVTFNGSNHTLQNVTIVAKGKITFNGACQEVTPYQNDVALMSLADSSSAITWNGSHQTAEGIIFAPNGKLTYNGSNGYVQHGSLVAHTITINGSGFTIEGTVGEASSADGSVALIR